MPRPPRLFHSRSAGLALLAAASVALLCGCTGESAGPTDQPIDPSASTTESAAPDATAAPEEPAEEPTPFAIGCDELLTADQLYAFNPNYGADPGYAPTAPAVVTLVEVDEGTGCGYLNQTSGEVIEIGVATPSPVAAEARRNDAALGSTPVPTYGTPPDVAGYFTQTGGGGQAQVFHGPYWLVIDSAALFEPGDAQQLVTDVLANLPAA